jgi:hemolysin III
MIFSKKESINQSIKEEIANCITHGLGFILSVIGLVFLVHYAIVKGNVWHIVSCSLYGASLISLYLISTLYHAITHEKAKRVFRVLDHISIYFLIAGTYMPLTLVVLNGPIGWILFGVQCGLCLVGVLFKLIFRFKWSGVSTAFYLLMGLVALCAIKPIVNAISFSGFMWILAGGIFYILGVIFFTIDKKISYFHTIWHVFVLGGSVCHFILVFNYVIPFTF